jgi:hypothetical protein
MLLSQSSLGLDYGLNPCSIIAEFCPNFDHSDHLVFNSPYRNPLIGWCSSVELFFNCVVSFVEQYNWDMEEIKSRCFHTVRLAQVTFAPAYLIFTEKPHAKIIHTS